MHSGKLLNRLDLDDDALFHNQIGPESFLKKFSPEANWDGHLPGHSKPVLAQGIRQNNFINRFQ